MDTAEVIEKLDEVLARLRSSHWKERDGIKSELLEIARAAPSLPRVTEHLEQARKSLSLEERWEVDEVLEALEPEPEPEPEAEAEAEEEVDPNRPLSMSDLDLVYDDPRGFQLYRARRGPERWFAMQRDPRTGQPQTFELQEQELTQLKAQLQGSPYWVLGAGASS